MDIFFSLSQGEGEGDEQAKEEDKGEEGMCGCKTQSF